MRLAVFLFTLLLPALSFAQTSLGPLRDRLISKPLFLTGQWRDNHLDFDSAGQLRGKSDPVSFTLSGFDVRSVDLKADKLVLRGHRAGLEFLNAKPQRVTLPDSITLTIDTPPDGNFEPALKAIFFNTLEELAPKLPPYWQPYAQANLLLPSTTALQTLVPPGVPNADKNVGYPRLIHYADPLFSSTAREIKYSGYVLVELEVDEAGRPQHLFLRTPTGLGLDEQALAAVSQYIFKPAARNGKPIAVVMDVDVDFQSF